MRKSVLGGVFMQAQGSVQKRKKGHGLKHEKL